MTVRDGKKLDLASVFPAKGDSRRPPDWWGRGLLYVAIAVFIAAFLWRSWGKVSFIVLDIVVSLFIALAIEPLVMSLVHHGWRRGAAAAVSLIGLCVVAVSLLALFGNLFVQQVISMVKGFPQLYDDLATQLSTRTSLKLPAKESLGVEILKNMQTSWITNFAGEALSTTVSLLTVIINLLTTLMVTYYVSAAGPKMRRSLCQWIAPAAQRRFLTGWTVIQDQISGFLFSRSILAAFSAVCMSGFLIFIHVPYWLPLSLFCGLASQFVPTVGTYIGGALPVLFAWGSRGFGYAIGVVVFITIYQQIENLLLAPKISQHTMNLNPAVAFLSVLVLGSVFGALGAFLALPVTASFQSIFKAYTRRYELVDSPLMSDPKPVKKSKVVAGAEAFNERVIKPVTDHIPRAVRGSTAKVPLDDEIIRLHREMYPDQDEGRSGESQTIAIPKRDTDKVAQRSARTKQLKGAERASAGEDRSHVKDTDGRGAGGVSGGSSRNPRKGWR